MFLRKILITVIAGSLVLALGVIFFFGSAQIVTSDSMAPAFQAGDLVLLQPVKEIIQPGMVVAYDFQGDLITHRVVEVVGDMLVTKGDNNLEIDPWRVPFASVIGEPNTRIPYAGYLLDFVKSPPGLLLLIILPACWILVIEARKVAANLRDSQGF